MDERKLAHFSSSGKIFKQLKEKMKGIENKPISREHAKNKDLYLSTYPYSTANYSQSSHVN
jgi:hypothetical protein